MISIWVNHIVGPFARQQNSLSLVWELKENKYKGSVEVENKCILKEKKKPFEHFLCARHRSRPDISMHVIRI